MRQVLDTVTLQEPCGSVVGRGPGLPWTPGPEWSCHLGRRMRGKEGLAMCLVLEEGSSLGQGWTASEGELGTLRLAREGSGFLGFGGREPPTHHPRRKEGLDVGTSGSPRPSGHSSSPSRPLHRKLSLQRENRWWMPLHLPTRSVPSRYPPPPKPLLSANAFERRLALGP